MPKQGYSDDQQETFVDLAVEIGIGPAMRELGYPSQYITASKWLSTRGVQTPHVDTLKKAAADLFVYYQDRDKVFAAQTLIERIVQTAMTAVSVTAKEQRDLAYALHTNIKTLNLIEGKATSIEDKISRDGTDLAIQDLISQAKAQNSLKVKELEADRQ